MFQRLFSIFSRDKLTVLLFHKVPQRSHILTPDELNLAEFEKVLISTMRLFDVLPLEDALHALRAGCLPPRTACITFDDGYSDWIKWAVPVLEKYKLPATFFITTGQFDGLPMWNERILHAVEKAPVGIVPLDLKKNGFAPLHFETVEKRRNTVIRLDQLLKYKPLQEREDLLITLEEFVGVNGKEAPVMSVEDLRELHSRGFAIGGHSVNHPILALCPPEQAYREISEARERLEELVGCKVTTFAYPNGIPGQDFTAEHIEMVKRAGYTSALTTHSGSGVVNNSVFQIPRFTPWGESRLKMELQFVRNLRQHAADLCEENAPQKKALMVAFHFPPQSGSSGVLRTLNFVKHLPKAGWKPIILTANTRAYESSSPDLLSAIPSDTKILRAFALDASRHLSIRRKYPAILMQPDRWSTWWPDAVRRGMEVIRTERPKLLWSTFPITTAHWITATLAKRSGLPWIADFRDPMISRNYLCQPEQVKSWRKLEYRVLRTASRCIFTSENAADLYRQRYPLFAEKCIVIPNGYDEEVFENNPPQRFNVRPDQTLILHSGLIYPKERDPRAFFAAVVSMIADDRINRLKTIIRFRASGNDEEIMRYAKQAGIDDLVEVLPPIPYRQAVTEMLGADLLLVFQGTRFNSQIPAKIYEYLRAGQPILGLVDPAGEAAAQLNRFEGTFIANIDDPKEITERFLSWMVIKDAPSLKTQLEANKIKVQEFSRSFHAKKLAKIFDELEQ